MIDLRNGIIKQIIIIIKLPLLNHKKEKELNIIS